MKMSKSSILARSFRCFLFASGLALLLACSAQTQGTAPASPADAPPRDAANAANAANAADTADTVDAADIADTAVTAATPAAARARTIPEGPLVEPPDGEWLVDEEGRQHFLQEVPKVEGWYFWLDPEQSRVRLWYGMVFDAADQDDDSITIKIYRPLPDTIPAAPRRRELTEADKKEIAASYRNETGATDRLTFQPFGKGLPARGQWRNGFKVADMNGDGHPDIVHGPARKGGREPNIFLGDGKGGWQRWAEVRFPPLPYDYGDVAVADLNGDGRQDLAFAVHLRGLIVLVADGPASFKEWGEGVDFVASGHDGEGGGDGYSTRVVEAADWNGDGRPDLISIGEGPRMAATPGRGNVQPGGASYGAVVFLNQGDGSWVRRDELAQRQRLFGDDLAVADLTRDGKLDLVLGSSVLGEKDILRIGGDDGSWAQAALPELRPRAYVGGVDAADFNGDGLMDIAVGYLGREGDVWRTGVDVLLARADGTWQRKAVAVEETRDWLTALDSGDLDGDGRLDLAAATGDGEIWIFLGKGDGTFLREEAPDLPPSEGGCRGYDIQIVNLDSEPGDELVAEFAGEPSALFAPTLCVEGGSLGAWKPRAKKKS